MNVVNLGQDPSPAIPNRSLVERTGSDFPLVAVLTLAGVLVGAVVKILSD